ncbi:hypothetical protein [Arthrobacter globiformis]|uniref:hypothetical protein n=1 Tax=Arthrobacter globiformis TaxID=1665 RepID=UPI0027D8E081|nr:hypothetical protein [Arthrobacter globiformis]
MADDELYDLAVSGTYCKKLPISDGFAVFINDGHVMRVRMGVDPDDDTCFGIQSRSCPSFGH